MKEPKERIGDNKERNFPLERVIWGIIYLGGMILGIIGLGSILFSEFRHFSFLGISAFFFFGIAARKKLP